MSLRFLLGGGFWLSLAGGADTSGCFLFWTCEVGAVETSVCFLFWAWGAAAFCVMGRWLGSAVVWGWVVVVGCGIGSVLGWGVGSVVGWAGGRDVGGLIVTSSVGASVVVSSSHSWQDAGMALFRWV